MRTRRAITVAREVGMIVDNIASKVRSDAPILLGNKKVNMPAAPESALDPKTNKSALIPRGVKIRMVKKIINPPVRTSAIRRNNQLTT